MTNTRYRLLNKMIVLFLIGIGIALSHLVVEAQAESNQIFLPTVMGSLELDVGQSTNILTTSASVQAAMSGSAIVGHGNNCLDIPYRNTTNGTNLHMWDCNGTVAQQWTVTNDGRITAMGKCLDVEGPYRGNGINVQIWDCLNVAQHRWTVTASGQIKSYDGRCLDVRGWGTANGTAVQLWSCVSPAISAQTWQVESRPIGNPSDLLTHQEALNILNPAGITQIVSSGNCTDRTRSNCTSLDGIRRGSIDGLINFKQKCDSSKGDCTIVITGGTETGHSTGTYSHENGYKIDIRWSFNGSNDNFAGQYIKDNFTRVTQRGTWGEGYEDPATKYLYVFEGGSRAHWDICLDSNC